jgi:multiple sugar transport system permease protein
MMTSSKATHRSNAATLATYAALIGLGLMFVAPFAWMILTAFKPEGEVFQTGLPTKWSLDSFREGLTHFPVLLYLRNTLLICGFSVLGTVLSSSMVAYGLARIPWRGRHMLFALLLATIMVPPQVTMVPLFTVFKTVGWIDSFLPLIVPAFLGNAFFVFLLRQFFLTIPQDLTDAARLDGCSEFTIYSRIILPLSKPALATVALFTFMSAWNDFLGPLIYLNDADKWTLSIGLAMFTSQYGSYWGQLMAVGALMTLPILVLFFLAQRTFIQGITLSGMKG